MKSICEFVSVLKQGDLYQDLDSQTVVKGPHTRNYDDLDINRKSQIVRSEDLPERDYGNPMMGQCSSRDFRSSAMMGHHPLRDFESKILGVKTRFQ